MKWLLGVTLGVCLFSLTTSRIFSQSPTAPAGVFIALSEVSACGSDEWVELYNTSSSSVDVTGWKIGKNVSGTITLSGTIAGNSYKKFSFTPGLNNTAFAVKLIDVSGDVIETFPFEFKTDSSSTIGCPSTTLVTSFIKQAEDWQVTTTQTPDSVNILTPLATSTPTPAASPTAAPTATGQPTASPTSTPQAVQPTNISLSEVYACQADGTKEWVEVYNGNDSDVTLSNWKLTDDDGNYQSIESLPIAAKGYAAIDISHYTRGMLTNDGDILSLIDGAGKTIEKYEYSFCNTQATWARISGDWKETATMTKGKANQYSALSTTSSTPQPTATATPKSTQSPSPTGSPFPSSTPTPVEPLATESGEILGVTTVSEMNPTPFPTPRSNQSSSNMLAAYGALGTGVSLLTGTLGYFGFEWWKKGHIV